MTGSTAVESSLELWNNHDREGYIACFAEDCEFNVPRRPGKGRAAVAAWWDFHATAFGPGNVRVDSLIESGQTVVLEAVYEATHIGPLLAVGSRGEIPATNRSIAFPYVTIYTVRDGLIGRSRGYWDGFEMLDQLGQTSK